MVKSFLVLPREIREEIYPHLLVTQKDICPFIKRGPRILYPQILRTCKIIFEEASTILIQQNRFVFHSSHGIIGSDSPPVWNPDYSWQIMLHRYHCTSSPLSSRLAPPSRRIRNLDLRFGNDLDVLLMHSCLRDHLNQNHMLKDLRIEIRSPWCIRALCQGLGSLARVLGRFQVTLTAVHGIDTSENDRFFDHVAVVVSMWNYRQERKFAWTGSRGHGGMVCSTEPRIQEWSLEP